jgi:hypothetical protein
MARTLAYLGDDKARDPDATGLEVKGDARLVYLVTRYAIVSDKRVGIDEYLAEVGGVGEGLGIAGHASREDDFSFNALRGAEGPAFVHRSVFEDKPGCPSIGFQGRAPCARRIVTIQDEIQVDFDRIFILFCISILNYVTNIYVYYK